MTSLPIAAAQKSSDSPSDRTAARDRNHKPTDGTVAGVIRDILAEAVDVVDCISGDGNAPDPLGVTEAECLALFDYDRDLDFDLRDYSTYLNALQRRLPPTIESGTRSTSPMPISTTATRC